MTRVSIGQPGISAAVDLSGTVRVDEVDSTGRATIERIEQYIREGQADEAVETLRQLQDQNGERLKRAGSERFVAVREYCQARLAALAVTSPDILQLYRERVDGVAKRLYDDGIARRNEASLRQVVQQYFASSFGDQAAFALGEIALEKGDYTSARESCERLDPLSRTADGRPLWLELWVKSRRQSDEPPIERKPLSERELSALAATRGCPIAWQTKIEIANIRARLVLVSILEGDVSRAELELTRFRQLHPKDTGRLAGKEGNFSETLTALLAEVEHWPAPAPAEDWTTFAGDVSRNRRSPKEISVGSLLSPVIKLGDPLLADVSIVRPFGFPERRPGEHSVEQQLGLLSYHPLIVGNLVVFCNDTQIFAFDVRTGQPAWPGATGKPPGEIYNENGDEAPRGRSRRNMLGVPRFTLAVHQNRLFARIGSPVTMGTLETPTRDPGKLVILDLAQQGKKLREISPGEKWAFEGAPVVDGPNLYVAMRYSDVRPQCHVACFDIDSGRMRWRRMICAAESISQGSLEEATHNLLTLVQQKIYVNSNLGAVAALAKEDGHLDWISLYPRSKKGDPKQPNTAHYYRDLNPCVFDNGTLFVAPTDHESILAMDAGTGQVLWESQQSTGEAVHLLGVSGGHLIASGHKLWRIDVVGGRIAQEFPEGNGGLEAYGRGLLAGEFVYWPTPRSIEVFSARTGERHKPIPLNVPTLKIDGGNLVAARGFLLIATGTKLYRLGP